MTMSAKERQALVGASHRLKPAATLAAGAVSEGAVAHVRQAFAGHAVLKVRVNADTGAACDAAAIDLAARVPCELVKRIGRIVLLYRPNPPADAGRPAGAG